MPEEQKKKGGALKWTGIGCGGLLVLLILMGGCVGVLASLGDDDQQTSESTEDNAGGNEQETEEATEDEEDPAEQEYGVGETADSDGQQITVTDVDRQAPGEFENLPDGYDFVVITIEIANESDEEFSYNPLDFDFIEGSGNIQTSYSIESLDGYEERLSSGALAPGGETSGTLIFEANTDDEDLTLRYSDNIFTDDTVDFNLYD